MLRVRDSPQHHIALGIAGNHLGECSGPLAFPLSATLVSLSMRTELVTTLKRQATEILNQLEKDREPILITQHGVPSTYLVDVETFETLLRRMTLLEGIARGEKAIDEGRSLTQKQAKQRMSRWLK